MKDILIIFAHPDNKTSLNFLVLENVIKGLTQNNKTYSVIDLYAENFNPVFSLGELRNGDMDSVVLAHHKLINTHKNLLFICPGWNYTIPAILKGWIDRVFVIPGYSFQEDEQHKYQMGLLKQTNAYIIQTIGGFFDKSDPTSKYYYGPLEEILKFVGVKNVKTFIFDRLYNVNEDKIKNLVDNSFRISLEI